MTFSVNKPVTTPTPTVVVDGGLPAGEHRFQLVVVGRSGRSSQPMEVVVTIEPRGPVIPGRPTPTVPTGIGPLPPFPP